MREMEEGGVEKEKRRHQKGQKKGKMEKNDPGQGSYQLTFTVL